MEGLSETVVVPVNVGEPVTVDEWVRVMETEEVNVGVKEGVFVDVDVLVGLPVFVSDGDCVAVEVREYV